MARAKCEKIFRGNAQCLSSEMIYRNDVLFFFSFPFSFSASPPMRPTTRPYSRILNAFFDFLLLFLAILILSSEIINSSTLDSIALQSFFVFEKSLRIGMESEVKMKIQNFLLVADFNFSLFFLLFFSFFLFRFIDDAHQCGTKRCVVVVFS